MSDIGVPVPFEDYREKRNNVVLDYTNRDYAAIRSQLVGLARGLMPEWETVGEEGDFGTLLLELFAYMGDVQSFYIDRAASETFLGTAIRRQSILYIANMFDYHPVEQQAAGVELYFSLDEQAINDVIIPARTTRLTTGTSNGYDRLVVFELDTEVKLSPGDTDIRAYATEGVTVERRFLGKSPGAPNDVFPIPDKGVVGGSVQIVTFEAGKQVQWTRVDRLATAGATHSAFTTWTDEDGTTIVMFGDNAAGRVPPAGADIFVSYRFGVGARANSIPKGGITEMVVSANLDTWGVTLYNPAPPQGGTDPESVESMRYSIPRAGARIKERAVTLQDYADLALQVPGVAKAVAHGSVYGNVYVRIAPVGGTSTGAYLSRLKAEVEEYLGPRVMIGSKVKAEPDYLHELWRELHIRIMVHVEDGFNRTNVRLAVDAAVRADLAFENQSFGSSVSVGQIYRTALAIQGVEWVEVNWLNVDAPTVDDELALDTDSDYQKVVNLVPAPESPEELLIPRIAANPPTKPDYPLDKEPTDFDIADPNRPGLPIEGDERMFDGLWVKAVGGLAGT